MRRNLNFRASNKREKKADDLLERCPKKSRTALCAIALNYLSEEFNLDNAEPEEILETIQYFNCIKRDKERAQRSLSDVSTEHRKATPVTEKIVEKPTEETKATSANKNLVSDSDKNAMADIMSSLFS